MATLIARGGIQRATPSWPTPQETIGMTDDVSMVEYLRPKLYQLLFIISCVLAAVIDPIFLYCHTVRTDQSIYDFRGQWPTLIALWMNDPKMFVVTMGLRSGLDVVYIIDVVLFFLHIRRVRRKLILKRERNKLRYCNSRLTLGIVIAIPVGFLYFFYGLLLLPFLAMQYGLRIFFLYGLLSPKIEAGKWLKAILDGFPFILSAHLIGAIWYILAILREIQCFTYMCRIEKCDFRPLLNSTLVKIIHEACSGKSMTFDLGIYANAIQSGMTRSKLVPLKIFQGFWWGLRNLSSLGSNLQMTSFFVESHSHVSYWTEICFSIVIFISGMLLFLIYLNQRVEEAKKRSMKRNLRQKIQKLNPDVDLWLSNNALPKSLKVGIMKMVHLKLEENNFTGVDTILSILPLRDRRCIMSQFRLTALKKVPAFDNMDERVLKAVCEHLRLVIYAEEKDIFREGEPLDKMLFIRQGSALSYTPISTNSLQESSRCSSDIKCLEKGDFFGEEILEWATSLNPFSDIPISREVVKSQSKVEAFTIRAKDLRSVVCKFWWFFSVNDPDPQRWERLAASFVLAKWGPRHT